METARPTFVAFFPEARNVHLAKGVGVIPAMMAREQGYAAVLLTFDQGPYPSAPAVVPEVRLSFLETRWPRLRRLIHRINAFSPALGQKLKPLVVVPAAKRAFRRERVDAMMLYHFTLETLLVARALRRIQPRAKIHLKMDIAPDFIERPGGPWFLRSRAWLTSLALRLVSFDVISVETERSLRFFQDEHPVFRRMRERIILVPNGVHALPDVPPATERQKLVLHVGRAGSPQKATDVALAAFAKITDKHPEWKLVLVGPEEPALSAMLERFAAAHPAAASRLERRGEITDRRALYRAYGEASVLLHPARWEAFSNATLEAAAMGLVVVGSDIVSLRELTDGERLGKLAPVDDIEALALALDAVFADDMGRPALSAAIAARTRERYSWSACLAPLAEALRA
ncbi:MAG TPA: glycosyltransferase family 4 protein [Candidatus Thermoplasmatota archaeon]|nr:glycosyltransferase family 4 protein [Candidatus Thermoplasmatota archaeon]